MSRFTKRANPNLCHEKLRKKTGTNALKKIKNLFNPSVPSVLNVGRLAKILILISERILINISYERRDYESVDEKSLS